MREESIRDIVSPAKKHTIKKFEIIEKYVEAWAQKMLNHAQCEEIAFIDCMSNSGLYVDEKGQSVKGTPVRVADYISGIMPRYANKRAWLCFNDIKPEKIETLSRQLPKNTRNFEITLKHEDANSLLKAIAHDVSKHPHSNYLLVYDPFEATIDWEAIDPFLQGWGEVIINHMVSDTVRALPVVKRRHAIEKYEQTYGRDFDELVSLGGDRRDFEKIITSKIIELRKNSKKTIFIASFPFFNTCNAVVYNLIHCTGSLVGFKLFKKVAWQVFGGKSSLKDTHGSEDQYAFLLDGSDEIATRIDEDCYSLKDVAAYVQKHFQGKSDIPLKRIWEILDNHPIFPSDGFKPDIKKLLKQFYGCIESKGAMTFSDKG